MIHEHPLNTAALVLTLTDWRVDYVVIGSAAAHAHGASRRPADLDVVIGGDQANLARTVNALRDLNARPYFPGITREEQAQLPPARLSVEILQISLISGWMTRHGPLDLFDGMLTRGGQHRSYADVARGAQRQRVGGIPTDVASIGAIIDSKLAVGRPKDLDDVAELRRVIVDRAHDQRPAGPAVARTRGRGVERHGDVAIGL